MRTKILLISFIILLSSVLTYAQSGTLDLSYNSGTGANRAIYTIANQNDGKVIIGGGFWKYSEMSANHIARLNEDGSLDTSFDIGTGTDNTIHTISIQNDGKVIIGGQFTSFNGIPINRIARLNTDGSLDTTFNPGTGANSHVLTSVIQNDGKIIIGGWLTSYNGTNRNYLTRINTDGSLDTTFNPGTGVNDWVLTSTIQSDGKIIIGGQFTTYNGTARNHIARLNWDGSLDNTFNPGTGANFSAYPSVSTASIQSDGKIIICGRFTTFNGKPKNYLARLNADGSLDASFDSDSGANMFVHSISIQDDGKIIIGGAFTSYNGIERIRIARLNSDGSLDNTFNPGIGPNLQVVTSSIQSGGKVIIGGHFTYFNGTPRNSIARLTAYGTSVPSYDKNESRFNIFPNPFSSNTTLQSGQSIYDGTITIYNTLGEVVSQLTNINGQSVTINRDNLANGLYFIRLTEGKDEIMMKKVIVVD